MRISDWSSDVCSSDLGRGGRETSARLVRRRLLGNQLRRPGERPGRRMAKDRTMNYRASGKQVLKAGEYFADASTNEAARVIVARSEERRVGNECVSTCRSRGSPEH